MLTDSVKKNALLLSRNVLQDLLNQTLKQYHVEDSHLDIDFGIPIVFWDATTVNSLQIFELQHFDCSVLPIGYNSQLHCLALHPLFNTRPTPMWLLSHLLFWGYCLSKHMEVNEPMPFPWRKERVIDWLHQKHFKFDFDNLKKAHQSHILVLPALSVIL